MGATLGYIIWTALLIPLILIYLNSAMMLSRLYTIVVPHIFYFSEYPLKMYRCPPYKACISYLFANYSFKYSVIAVVLRTAPSSWK